MNSEEKMMNFSLRIVIALFIGWSMLMTNAYAKRDVHTQSNYDQIAIDHMSLNLDLHLDKKYFEGFVDLTLKYVATDLGEYPSLILDTKGLNVSATKVSVDGEAWEDALFNFGPPQEVNGQLLTISLQKNTKMVRVFYQTTEKSEGLDWVGQELTRDKISPMVVTQFQAINARTFVPCQDTPASKITYDATIKLHSENLDPRLRVNMATDIRKDLGDRRYFFKISNKIPTYLIALNAGVFEEQAISDRVKIIAEPSMVKAAAWEFADAERMVAKAEELFGNYVWGRFDIFVMPPSFSYGGMENPTMTFIGPTVINGDRSLVDVIAHELAHSWAGNLVSNFDWNHFWINEGTTMYLERLIIEALYGAEHRDMDIVLGQKVLHDDIAEICTHQHENLTRLRLKLTDDFHPDDSVSYIPYEKGFNFWLALEQAYGKAEVLAFLKSYFQKFAFQSITTKMLEGEIKSWPTFDGAHKIDFDQWFKQPRTPQAGLPVVKSDLLDKADQRLHALMQTGLIAQEHHEEIKAFHSKQWSYLLKSMKDAPLATFSYLNDNFELYKKNYEVRSSLLVRAIQSGHFQHFMPMIDSYLGEIGRLKYVRPIYLALIEKGHLEFAKMLFEKYKSRNNAITNGTIEKRLNK